MSPLLRTAAALLLASLPLAALACGGKVADDGSTADSGPTPPPDTSPVPPPPPDTPSTCGFGTCSPGESCSPGPCTYCMCDSSGGWSCAGTPGCIDGGPTPVCPPYIPIEGTACSGSVTCPFTNDCGKMAYAICDGASWRIKSEICPPTSCPSYEPGAGTSCSSIGTKCSWTNGCGGTDYGLCDYGGWTISVGPCPPPPPPPPPPPECPKSEPTFGTPCSSSGLACTWANSCGTTDYGYCSGGYWSIKSPCSPPPPPPPPPVCPPKPPSGSCTSEGAYCTYPNSCGGTITASCSYGMWGISDSGCAGTCPKSRPASGSACGTPSTTGCPYPAGSACISYCFCADDYRWACLSYGSGCGGPVPPPADAGPPSYDVGFAEAGGM